ncbi:spinocerebellar ataxia type 10 protein domain-containing protein [Chlamydoabsidia padenii]|nr:spinocerebellar ataxia type 10 protein domain-containing protein [Chlamydoabsidia padenii]
MAIDLLVKTLGEHSVNGVSSHDLETTLKEAIQRTMKDHSYRLDLGQKKDFWTCCHELLNDQSKDLAAHTTDNTNYLPELIKLARNVTAANPLAQNLALDSGTIHILTNLIHHHLPNMDENSTMMIKICTQAVCNMVTGNDVILDIMWSHWTMEQRQPLWNKVIESNDKDTVTAALILVSQCIRNNKQRCGALVSTQGGITYLGAVVMEIDRAHNEESNQHFELGYIIINELLKNGYFVDTFDALKDTNSSVDIVNQKQMVIIKMLDSTLYKHPEISIPLTTKDFETLVLFLCSLSEQACQVIDHALTTHRDQQSNLELDKVSLMYTCLVLSLQITNLLLTSTSSHGQEMKSIFLTKNGLQFIIELLRQCDRMVDWKDKEKSKLGFDYVKREIVKCIGSLCYKDKSIQDEIRTSGGLALVLNQMKIDDTNPYIREHATVALRHLLEDNADNQQMIADMAPLEAVQNDDLDQMGLKSSLVNGKIHLENTKK